MKKQAKAWLPKELAQKMYHLARKICETIEQS